ncbi:MAG: hypothetical protein AAF518_25040, partial [Spirochaetota bacterium]
VAATSAHVSRADGTSDAPQHVERLLHNGIRPQLSLANGWYKIEITGGETMQDNGLEPTFEFRLRKSKQQPQHSGDIQYRFTIDSSEY